MSLGKTATLNSGYTIPTLGYGTWQSAPGEVGAGVYEALKAGYRHLDLAKIYGNQREVAQGIKRALAEVPGLQREHLFITSKLWNSQHRPENVEAALDDCLAELELDYLDLYLIHWPVAFAAGGALVPKRPDNDKEVLLDRGVSIVDTWKAMTRLPKTKARTVGVSNFSIEHLEAVIKATGAVPAVNQIERHPRLPNPSLARYCADKGILITAYSAFGNNNLGVPLLVASPEVKAVAGRLGATPAQVILAWSQRGGHAVIPKSVTPARIRENFQEVELDADAVAALDRLGEAPRRFNVPINYPNKWDVDVFGEEEEKEATHKVDLSV